MRRDRGAVYAALVSTLLSVLLAVAVNVGTGGALPGPLGDLAWLAWPLVGVLTAVTVWLAVRDGSAPAPPGLRPAELPADDRYTGRADDLARLRDLVRGGRRVVVVSGPAGIGKSALATRLARDLATDYPDGQLHAALGAGTGTDAAPEAVLTRFLDAFAAGIAGPADRERLAAHYRTTLDGRRVLVLLDDARDAAQVRPLLPGSPGCLTVVTSRAALADLPGAVTYDLGVLTTGDALALLRHSGAGDRVDAEPEAAAAVVAACGGLPLALRLAAGRLVERPGWTVADLAARLRGPDRLGELRAGALGMRAVFDRVHADLDPADQRALRRLGAWPGRDLPAEAAAALTGDPAAAERLADGRLLDAVRADRYRIHDLVREYAAGLLAAQGADGPEALTRLVDWYAATLPDATAAWIDAEVENVALVVRAALDRGAPADALRLAVAADHPVLHRAGQRTFLRICRDRLRAAEALGDEQAVDRALTQVGTTATAYGHVTEGIAVLTGALARWRERDGDGEWLAFAEHGLGIALRDGGRNTEALVHLEAALAHFTKVGDRRRESQALTNLGITHVNRHDAAAAIAVLERALSVGADAPMHPQEGTWPVLMLATALQQAGRYAEARPLLDRARAGFADPVNWSGEGYALLELADAADAAGDHAAAAGHCAAARAAFARVDDRPGRAMSERSEGHHRARIGDAAGAAAAFDRAATAFEELGNPSNAGLDRLWRAEQLYALGRPDDAGAEVARAETLLAGSDLPVADQVRARLPRPREAGPTTRG